MTSEVESIRAALRGKRLPTLAAELDVPVTTLEMFVTDRANLAPTLMNAIAAILARQQNTPTPIPRNTMRLNARALKVTAMLSADELAALRDPGSNARTVLEIAVGGRTVTADIATKSVRKAKATINEHGAANVISFIQGKLVGDAIVEAGLVAQPRQHKDLTP
jgi:hypothetical protein